MRTEFNPLAGDRVCRKPGATGGAPKDATKDWSEAVLYATKRAQQTGRRQRLKRHNRHGWWLTIVQDDPIEV